MQIKETHLIAVVAIVLVGILLFAQRQQFNGQVAKQRAADVSACTRHTERASLNAVGWNDVALAREQRGDTKDAIQRAQAIDRALMETVTPPKGMKRGDVRMFETVTLIYPDGKRKLQLTPEAKKLQLKGCEAAFPAP